MARNNTYDTLNEGTKKGGGSSRKLSSRERMLVAFSAAAAVVGRRGKKFIKFLVQVVNNARAAMRPGASKPAAPIMSPKK